MLELPVILSGQCEMDTVVIGFLVFEKVVRVFMDSVRFVGV